MGRTAPYISRGTPAPAMLARPTEAETFNDTSNRHLWRVGDGLAGWGHETRTTESIWTEIRLSCRKNFARFGRKHVQRRCQCELRVCEPAAAAGSWQIMSRGRTKLNNVLGFTRAGQRNSNRGQAKKIIRADVSFRSTSASNRAMHCPTDTEPSRLAPPPASAARPPRGFGGAARFAPVLGEEL